MGSKLAMCAEAQPEGNLLLPWVPVGWEIWEMKVVTSGAAGCPLGHKIIKTNPKNELKNWMLEQPAKSHGC